MVAEDFLQDQQVRQWLDGVEPAWTLLTFDSLRALRRQPSARQNAIRIANDLSADEIAGSAVTRNTFILLRQAIERSGLPLVSQRKHPRQQVRSAALLSQVCTLRSPAQIRCKNGFCGGCPSLTGVCCGDRTGVEEINLLRPWSQLTQIFRHIAELLQYHRPSR